MFKVIFTLILFTSSVLTAMSTEEFKAKLQDITEQSKARMQTNANALAVTPGDELMCEEKIRESISAYRCGLVNEYTKCTSNQYFYMVNKNGVPYRYDRKSKVFSKIKID